MIDLRRGQDRPSTSHGGITTLHAFSSGPHFDPDNTAFGPLVAFDEHVLAPGAEFAEHAHRGVDLVTWVVEGTLRHVQPGVRVEQVGPGLLAHQDAGSGIRHCEGNASDRQPLRFLQLALLTDSPRSGYALASPPLRLSTGELSVREGEIDELVQGARSYVHVVSGAAELGDATLLPGDSARLIDESIMIRGRGAVLIWRSV